MHAEVNICEYNQPKIVFFAKNNVLFYIIVIYYHFNIPTKGLFRCADTHMHINFQQNLVNRSVIIENTNLFAQKISSCINLQLAIVTFKKSTLSDMYHRKTYMYINFQQNQVSQNRAH